MKRYGVALLLLFFVSSVSGAIIIDDNFRNLYNVGDSVKLDFSLSSSGSVHDFSDVYLVCDGDNSLVDKRYVFLDEEIRNFSLEFPLFEEGDCFFEIDFMNDDVSSEEFEISERIDIDYMLNDKFFFPLEIVRISGNATKANGDSYEGVVEFIIDGLVTKTVEVSNGEFHFDYEVRSGVVPGDYDLSVEVFEKDLDGDIMNFGKIEDEISIEPYPTSIEIVSPDKVSPSESEVFSFNLLDQVGDVYLNDSLIVKMFDSNNNLTFQKEIESAGNFSYFFPSDFVRGSAYLNAYYGSIFKSVPIYVEDNKEINVSLHGNNLIFRNVGNVPYIGAVSFSLNNGEVSEDVLVNVSLGIGETYEYLLEYSGLYNITASGGVAFSNSYLTGMAVFSDYSFGFWTYFISILIILICIGLYLYFRFRRKPVKEDSSELPVLNNNFNTKKISMKKGDGLVVSGGSVSAVKDSPSSADSLRENSFIIFLKSKFDVSVYSEIVSKYNLTLNCVDENVGYVLFYQGKGMSPSYRSFNIGRALVAFSKVRGDTLSIVVNRAYLDRKVDVLKKFASFNKKILDLFPGKFIVGDKIISSLKVHVQKVERVVEVMGRRVRLWEL